MRWHRYCVAHTLTGRYVTNPIKSNEFRIKTSIIFALILGLVPYVHASDNATKLACMAGASADIDGANSYRSDASGIRFLLTLYKNNGAITSIDLKHTGVMEAMPKVAFDCIGDSDIYSCSNLSSTIWYYPEKSHGVYASLGIRPIFEEKRANTGGIYNYSCSTF
ncbi:hypothetical protein P3719_24235 [Vibrio parahaemolyticus]|nr:hypothetical protein [Vibrio parahaemolyticus]MCA6691636.1 hypothetical protein [Vibrio parahaemolyticus]MDF5585980.1 hypothetical protein [Vibrio parahaemolyticus]MDF5591171.1 hypothetical protein [Vibrio parahaemolyticus]MDG2871538.1 hypothetical protein [Vibrio parahaemolyticus]